jgi:hypothetical protein
MSHFAKVVDGVVTQVIVAEPEFFETFVDTSPGTWLQTSYNTHGGVHANGGTPLRKNYAGIGFTYDAQRDAFIPPKPFASWTLNEDTCLWDCPVAYPTDGNVYSWDEESLNWVARPVIETVAEQNIIETPVIEISMSGVDSVNGADSIGGGV